MLPTSTVKTENFHLFKLFWAPSICLVLGRWTRNHIPNVNDLIVKTQRQSYRKMITLWCDKDHNKSKYTSQCKGTKKKVKMTLGKLAAYGCPFHQGMDITAKGKKGRKWPRTLVQVQIQRSRYEESPRSRRRISHRNQGKRAFPKRHTNLGRVRGSPMEWDVVKSFNMQLIQGSQRGWRPRRGDFIGLEFYVDMEVR